MKSIRKFQSLAEFLKNKPTLDELQAFLAMFKNDEVINVYRKKPIRKWLDIYRTDGLADSDRAAIQVFKAAGLCANDEYMTVEEAQSVTKLPNFSSTDIVDWDWKYLNNIENFELYMSFSQCKKLNFTNFYDGFGQGVVRMFGLFAGCESLEKIDLSNWDLSQNKSMGRMFGHCKSLYEVNLQGIDTNMCNDMSELFRACTSLENIDVHSLDTSNVTNMKYMFENANKLTEIDVSSWNTSNVTDARQMFANCYSIKRIILPENFMENANIGNEYNNGFFTNCRSIETIELPDNFAKNSIDLYRLFYGCTNLTEIKYGKNFGTNVKIASEMFANMTSIKKIILPEGFGEQLEYLDMFGNNPQLEEIYFPDYCGVNADLLNNSIHNLPNLKKIHFGKNFGNSATSMKGAYHFVMLCACPKLETIENLNIPNVVETNMTNIGGASLVNVTAVKLCKCSILFSASPLLSEDSLRSIINALNEDPLEGATLYLHADAGQRLESMSDYSELLASATSKRWQINY